MLKKFPRERDKKPFYKKTLVFLLLFLMAFSFLSTPKQVKAQAVVSDPGVLAQAIKDFFETKIGKAIQKAGSIAYQRTLSSALNKIAYDAANYIGSGGRGQEQLYITEDWGTYLKNIGDEASGQFLESFVRNLNTDDDQKSCEERTYDCFKDCYQMENEKTDDFPVFKEGDTDALEGWLKMYTEEKKTKDCISMCAKAATSCSGRAVSTATSRVVDDGTDYNSFDVCQPSSIEAKLQISLGLTDQAREQGPNCTGTEIISNWGEGIEGVYNKITSIRDGSLFANIDNYFDPRGNDLGIYLMARSDISEKAEVEVEAKRTALEANEGWLDVRDIAGTIQGKPQEAREADAEAREIRIQNFGKTTGDILVDAANIFLNQLAISAYNNVMRNLTDRGGESADLNDYSGDVSTGESRMREKTRILIEPQYNSKSDYSILAALSSCPDPENPGYNDCVINETFMQAISEGITLGQAIENGYLNKNWRVEKDYYNNAHNDHFSLRNIKILRKYRILPLGWEVAIDRAFEDEESPRLATLGDLVSCFDDYDKYEEYSSNFELRDTGWCKGLVDPNWVLKAPLNYCAKEGAGNQILSSFIVPGIKNVDFSEDTLSEIMILRDDNYCADNQSCIKENSNGSCDLYGYCTEEKRTWNFEGNSCSPIANTCQSFINTESREKISYLQNTIDYADCNIDNAGCKMYSYNGDYDVLTNQVAWDTNFSLNLNNNLKSCNNSSQGCSELLRVKPTWGSNLIIDSNFSLLNEDDDYLSSWSFQGEAILIEDMSEEIYGQGSYRAVKISGNPLAYINSTEDVFPKDLQILANQNYTLSADVYLEEGDSITAIINPGDYQEANTVSTKGSWRRISVTGSSLYGLLSPSFRIGAYNQAGEAIFYIKNIKFELGDWSTNYNSYGSFKVYQKLIPEYLEESCYEDVSSAEKDYTLKTDAPTICSNYTKKCNASEVGCNLFTGVYNNLQVPAQVSSSDYCANECVGYDMYIAQETYFNPAEAENIIPKNSQVCSAQAVGCNEFTNLDAIEEGGENKEYYVSLKHCIKPNADKCGEFYTWEAGTVGELTKYTLQKDEDGNPLTVGDFEEADCSDIYDLKPSDPNYNPDCKQFVNVDGDYSYKLFSKTITCSNDCYSYRLNGENIDKNIRIEASCRGIDKHWNESAEVCYVCKNGGTWSSVHDACIYQAIPNEGQVCRSIEAGCREYNGSNGNNTRIIAAYDFDGDLDSWYSNCSNGVSLSSISNSQNGQSLYYNASATDCDNSQTGSLIKRVFAGDSQIAKVDINSGLSEGRGYTLRFMARAESDSNISIYFESGENGDEYYFTSSLDREELATNIEGGGSWKIYTVNLGNLEETINYGTLNISGSGDIFIDNLTLTEITDKYFLKQGSSDIPDICYYDNLGEYQGPNYNLGCSLYKDKDNLSHALHNFTNLCALSSVGCEQMIYTQNYSSPQKGVWNDGGDGVCDAEDTDCVEVERDSAVYAVYNRSMSCSPSEAGCSLMGQASGEGQGINWTNVSKINDPDTYSDSLCLSGDINCDEYKLENGSYSYFKNPGSDVCVFKLGNEPGSQIKSWYKAPVKRCDYDANGEINGSEMSGKICGQDIDCGQNTKCITDNNDYPCSTTYFKTIGLGGTGGQVAIPDKSTALCDANSSGCTEYIDPVSKFNPNLVINSKFATSTNNTIPAWGEDEWLGNTVDKNQQVIQFDRNKLYSIVITQGEGKNADDLPDTTLKFVRNSVRFLEEDNDFSEDPTDTITVKYSEEPKIFNTFDNYSALLTRPESLPNKYSIEIKELVIDYQLKDNINKSDCSGVTDFDAGCVLFNERAVNGSSGLASNIYNAFQTIDKSSPVINRYPKNANQLIKVSPNRTCAKWLTCTSYGLDDDGNSQCYSLGECSLLDEKNECVNVINYSQGEQTTFDPEKNRNSSGFALANKNYYSEIKEVGLNSTVHYDFEEAVPSLSCTHEQEEIECMFDENITQDLLVREPEGAPTDYPAQGKTYLKINPYQYVSPHGKNAGIILSEGGQYYINFLLNTRDSGGKALIIIQELGTNETILEEDVSSPFGWSRVVVPFSLNPDRKNTSINIFLASKTEYPVYFDDINIEPVLELSNNEYVAKDCRLYPTSESLDCFDNDNSIIRNGLEGYCLEYDIANPSICQQWLPVDKISSSQLPSSQLGYNGKMPLTYCAEVNLNFSLLEKRKAAIVRVEKKRMETRDDGRRITEDIRHCFYAGPVLNYCKMYFGGEGEVDENGDLVVEGENVGIGTSSGQTVTTDISLDPDENDGYNGTGTVTVSDDISIENYRHNIKVGDRSDPRTVIHYCGSPDYFLIKFQDVETEYSAWVDLFKISYVCAPINNSSYSDDKSTVRWTPSAPDKLTLGDGNTTFSSFTDGWYTFNGFLSSDGSGGDTNAIGFDEYTNATPPIRVLDRNNAPPASEDGLKQFNSQIPEQNFELSCDKFVNVVTGNGENVAQVTKVEDRVKNREEKALDINDSHITYNNYIRNIGDVPYGASYWSDNFDLTGSSRVPLYGSSRKSDDLDKTFAGRPFGCSFEGDDGDQEYINCSMIGYCSGNPDVYCLVDNKFYAENFNLSGTLLGRNSQYYLAKQSCGTYGVCQPLWTSKNDSLNDFKNGNMPSYDVALSQLFLKSYNAYKYDSSNGGYISVDGYDKTSEPEFTGEKPSVGNISLYYGNSMKKVEDEDTLKAGNYRLEFNTSVNENQQPLRQIIIDWGDFMQVVINEDHRPEGSGKKHVYYHYYSDAEQAKNINIRIIDNWNTSSETVEIKL